MKDTLWDLKLSIERLRGISVKHQRLGYHGHDLLKDAITLSDYNIKPNDFVDLFISQADGESKPQQDVVDSAGLVLSEVPGAESKLPDDTLSDSFSMSESTAIERIQFWHHKARLGRFDADTHIVDPLAHYDHLNYLENSVIQESEYFRCKGNYDPQDEGYFKGKDYKFSDETWKSVQDNFVLETRISNSELGPQFSNPISSKEAELGQRDATSLRKSYTILCNILTSFDHLRERCFCTNFYSLLVQHPDDRNDIARLVQISQRRLDDWRINVESAIGIIARTAMIEDITNVLVKRIAFCCKHFFDSIGLPLRLKIQGQSRTFIIETFRMAVVLCDLALVSYIGSHGSRFPKRHLDSESEGLRIVSFDLRLPVLTCSLRPLSCLREFLDDNKVWVFGFENDQLPSQPVDKPPRLSILTHIDTFADVWGPVWSFSVGNKFPSDRFQQYNLSRGRIYPLYEIGNGPVYGIKDAVVCHWDQFLPTGDEETPQNRKYLRKNDILLIGANLWQNHQCKYKFSRYDRDYGSGLADLGTARPEWRPETWTVGIAGGQYLTVNTNVTRKKYPGTTLKENIWAKFKYDPRDANIEYLNQLLGVEISHCSGNARRVKLKDLFLIRRVKNRLNVYKPDWATTNWGQLFAHALEDSNFATMRTVWNNQEIPEIRENIADLVCKLLWDLNHTGERDPHFVAAYYNRPNPEKQIELQIQTNTWGKCLRDSTLVATYAVVGETCLKYSSTNNPGAPTTCRNEIPASRTVLETAISCKGRLLRENDCVKIGEFEALFRVTGAESDDRHKPQIIRTYVLYHHITSPFLDV